jgi:hypothetical protein
MAAASVYNTRVSADECSHPHDQHRSPPLRTSLSPTLVDDTDYTERPSIKLRVQFFPDKQPVVRPTNVSIHSSHMIHFHSRNSFIQVGVQAKALRAKKNRGAYNTVTTRWMTAGDTRLFVPTSFSSSESFRLPWSVVTEREPQLITLAAVFLSFIGPFSIVRWL